MPQGVGQVRGKERAKWEISPDIFISYRRKDAGDKAEHV